eukprot:jgi/Bigna1/88890/estExt_fgenesh1_pg.C_400015
MAATDDISDLLKCLDVVDKISGPMAAEASKTASKEDLAFLDRITKATGKAPETIVQSTLTKTAKLTKVMPSFKFGEESRTKLSKITTDFKKVLDIRLKNTEIRRMFKNLDAEEKLDLCFICDITGSMCSYIKAVRKYIEDVIAKVKKLYPKVIVRLAFVGYKDLKDDDQFHVLHFTDDILKFKNFLERCANKCGGGGDECEDLEGAVNCAKSLNWSSRARQIIHLADAPTHGRKYHKGCGDNYLDGNPNGLDFPTLIEEIRDQKGVENYCFCKLNSSTDFMIQVLNKEIQKPAGAPDSYEYMQEMKIGTEKEVAGAMFSIASSIASSTFTATSTIGLHSKKKTKAKIELEHKYPDWEEYAFHKVVKCSLPPVQSLGAVRKDDATPKLIQSQLRIKVAKKPFAQGSLRLAYYGVTRSGQKVVLKELTDKKMSDNIATNALKIQELAIFFADQYNKKHSSSSSAHIRFLPCSFVKFMDGKIMWIEPEIPEGATFDKYCDNNGHWNWKNYSGTMASFLKYTHHLSDGWLMVSDLQGVRLSKKEFVLTDPAILCLDTSRFQPTNSGKEGMKRLLNEVKRAPDIHSIISRSTETGTAA